MDEVCAKMHELMSGYLDGELDEDDTERIKGHLESCADCRREFNEMTLVVSAAEELSVEVPPDEVWDEFLDNVYNRVERKTGWFLVILGVFIGVTLSIYLLFFSDILATEVRITIELIFVGLALLFSNVMRQRLHHRKTDRYSRDVHR